MASRNLPWLFFAFFATLLAHLSVLPTVVEWVDRDIIPELSEESLEIDLSELMLKPKSEKDESKKPTSPPRHTPLPKKKKILDPSLKKDRILDKKPQEQSQKTIEPVRPIEKDIKPVKQEKPEPKEEKRTEKIEESISPLFVKKPEIKDKDKEKLDASKEVEVPEAVKKTFRNNKPEATKKDTLEYSLNTYKWTFKRFLENWAIDIQKWWKPPLDYVFGRVPEGGDIWIQVMLNKTGRMLGYRILKSKVSAEMELKVIQALVGSLERPELPEAFPEDTLVVNWRFIYPPFRPPIDLRR